MDQHAAAVGQTEAVRRVFAHDGASRRPCIRHSLRGMFHPADTPRVSRGVGADHSRTRRAWLETGADVESPRARGWRTRSSQQLLTGVSTWIERLPDMAVREGALAGIPTRGGRYPGRTSSSLLACHRPYPRIHLRVGHRPPALGFSFFCPYFHVLPFGPV